MKYDYYKFMNKRPAYSIEAVQLIVTKGLKPVVEGHEGDWVLLQTGWHVAVIRERQQMYIRIMDAIEENEEFTKY